MTNTLAYYDTATITAVKFFIVQPLVLHVKIGLGLKILLCKEHFSLLGKFVYYGRNKFYNNCSKSTLCQYIKSLTYSSFLVTFVNYDLKKFYNIVPRTQSYYTVLKKSLLHRPLASYRIPQGTIKPIFGKKISTFGLL